MKNFTVCPFCQNEGLDDDESAVILLSVYELQALMEVDDEGNLRVVDPGSDDGQDSDGAMDGRLTWYCQSCGASWDPLPENKVVRTPVAPNWPTWPNWPTS